MKATSVICVSNHVYVDSGVAMKTVESCPSARPQFLCFVTKMFALNVLHFSE